MATANKATRKQSPAQNLTAANRALAIELILNEESRSNPEVDIRQSIARHTDRNAAVEAVMKEFHNSTGAFGWEHSLPGDPEIIAKRDGLHVETEQGRKGIIRYVDLVDVVRLTAFPNVPPPKNGARNGLVAEAVLPSQLKIGAWYLLDSGKSHRIIDRTNGLGEHERVYVSPFYNGSSGVDAAAFAAMVVREVPEDPGRFGAGPGRPPAKKDVVDEATAAVDQALGQKTEPAREVGQNGKKHRGKPNESAGLKNGSDQVGQASPAAILLDVELGLIFPNPWQPRKEFPKEETAAFAEELKRDGLIMPVVVRRAGETFQIADGERRLRAAKHLKWSTITVVVREYSDEQMQTLAIAANDHRKELTPIERAHAFQRILDVQGKRAKDLETMFGHNQAFISNTLRLLKLPAVWQERVNKGELGHTHARHIMPFADHPGLLEKLAKKFPAGKAIEESEKDFRRAVLHFIEQNTRPMTGDRYVTRLGRSLKIFKPTADQLGQLQVIDVPIYWEPSRSAKRAVNSKLYDEIWKAHEAKAKPSSWMTQKNKKTPAKKMTPAEMKREDTKRRKEELAKYHEKIWEWLGDFYRYLIKDRLVTGPKADEDTTFRIAVWAIACFGTWDFPGEHDGDEMVGQDLMSEMVSGKKYARGTGHLKLWLELDPAEKLVEFARRALWDTVKGDERPIHVLPHSAVIALGRELKIDIAAAWAKHKAGPLTERYFNFHSDEQLVELAKELKTNPNAWNRKTLLECLLAQKAQKLPKELAAAKEPKR